MKHEELLKLTKDQLNARLKEIGASAKTAEGDVLDALLKEAQDIRDILDQAMAAGIQIGDIICEASGEEIKDIAAYQNIVIGSSVGETMEFVGKRLGSDGYVNIKFSVVTTEKEEVK